MPRASNLDNPEQIKDQRIQFLEEQAQWNLLVSEILTSLGDLHHQASVDRNSQALLKATLTALEKLKTFKVMGFFLVDEEDSDFNLALCQPESEGHLLQQAMDLSVEEGTFSWAIYQNKPVLSKPGWPGETLVMHVLATQRRVRGMFLGLMEGETRRIPEKTFYPLSLILHNTGKGLESIALYDLLHNKNLLLENRVQKRAQELEEQAVQLREEVTFRVIAEESLMLAKENLEKALHTKDEFLSNISHEIRTPLNAILGYAEILRFDLEKLGKSEYVEDMKIIESAGRHLLMLVNDILDMVNLQSKQMKIQVESIDLDPFLQDVMTTVRPLAEKFQNQLNMKIPPQLGIMVSDPVRVRQILLNLLSNASKFTQQGHISLKVHREAFADEDRICFAVSDTGIGLDPDKIESMFELFTRGEGARIQKMEGTGLGLPICRHLAELLGGDLQVESQLGKGSVFTLSLPVSLQVEKVKEFHSSQKTARYPKGESLPSVSLEKGSYGNPTKPVISLQQSPSGSLLIGEKDPVFRNLLCRVLEKAGYLPEIAGTGEALQNKLLESPPEFLILGNLEGEPDACQVVEQIQELCIEHPVSVVFVGDNPGPLPKGITILSKPLDWESLLKLLPSREKNELGKNILLIQADPMIRDILARLFYRQGWSVVSNSNPRVNFENLNQAPPTLVLLDFQPGLTEVQSFLNEFRRHKKFKQVPVFLITGRELTPNEMTSLAGQVTATFNKGHFSKVDLLTEVNRLFPA